MRKRGAEEDTGEGRGGEGDAAEKTVGEVSREKDEWTF